MELGDECLKFLQAINLQHHQDLFLSLGISNLLDFCEVTKEDIEDHFKPIEVRKFFKAAGALHQLDYKNLMLNISQGQPCSERGSSSENPDGRPVNSREKDDHKSIGHFPSTSVAFSIESSEKTLESTADTYFSPSRMSAIHGIGNETPKRSLKSEVAWWRTNNLDLKQCDQILEKKKINLYTKEQLENANSTKKRKYNFFNSKVVELISRSPKHRNMMKTELTGVVWAAWLLKESNHLEVQVAESETLLEQVKYLHPQMKYTDRQLTSIKTNMERVNCVKSAIAGANEKMRNLRRAEDPNPGDISNLENIQMANMRELNLAEDALRKNLKVKMCVLRTLLESNIKTDIHDVHDENLSDLDQALVSDQSNTNPRKRKLEFD